MVSAAVTLRPGTAPDRARTVAVEQLLVAAGQIGAGAGNLLFAIVMARLLAPAAFAHLTAFLGLFVLAGLPSTSLSAVGALAPAGSGRLDALLGRAGLAVAAALVGFSPWLARDLGLPVGVVIALAMAAPVVAPLGLQRGRLFGVGRHADLLASLLAEPVGRLTIGVLLGLGFGATGAAFGVAVAAVLALRVSYGPMAPSLPGVEGVATAGLGGTVAAFLLLAVVQTQDLLFANRLLGGAEAGRFAVLSTLGGIAAFATLTVPLVLLPRAARGQSRALPIAVGIAAAIGGMAVVVGAVAHDLLTRSLFGARYGAVAPLLAPYLLAMALLGVSRVLVAHRCARGEASSAVVVVGLVAAGQAWLIVHFAHSAAAVAGSTLSATATATAVLGGMEVAERMRWRARLAERVATAGNSVVVGLAGITAVGLAVRLVVPRGLWLDEATSVFQAKMGFSEMLTNLRTTDVHPPLYFTVLWGAVRVFGSSEMAVRLPSIVAGLALLPVLYLCGEELYDRRTGLVAAAIGSVSPLLVWYSQEARMYALFMVFAVAAVWLQARAIRRGRTLDWMLYAVVTAALVWTQYFAVLQVLVQQAAFLVVIARRQARRTLDRRVIY